MISRATSLVLVMKLQPPGNDVLDRILAGDFQFGRMGGLLLTCKSHEPRWEAETAGKSIASNGVGLSGKRAYVKKISLPPLSRNAFISAPFLEG